MRAILLIGLVMFTSLSRAECDRSLSQTIKTSARNFATGAAALGLAGAGVPTAQAAGFLTLDDVRQTLTTDYQYSAKDADRVIQAITKYDPQNQLPISGIMHTSGLSFSFILGTGTWSNVQTNFKDEATGRIVATDCLYDMTYYNGGIAASLGYKWVVMILFGDTPVTELAGAKYGRGLGLTFDVLLGGDVQYLPSNNRASSMMVINPQIGVGGGIRFPKIKFSPAASCSR